MTRALLAWHRALGLVAGVMILIAAGTAIGLNHQDMIKTPPTVVGESGPYGRYILSLATDPTDPDHMLMGTSDGLFRTDDGGSKWEEAVLPVPAEQVNALLFDPKRPEVVYVSFREYGIFKSEDAGIVWEEVKTPFNPVEGTRIQGLSLGADGQLVVATTAGLYLQAGAEWRHVPRPAAKAAEKGKGMVQLIYDLHDGNFWGAWGVPITDAVSVALIVLVLTGYGLYFGRALKVRAARKKVTKPHEAPRTPAGSVR